MLLHNIVSIYLVITTTTTDSTAHRTRHGLSEVELKFLRQISTQRYDSSSARNSTNDNYGIVGDFTGGTDFYSELDRRGTKNEVRHGAKRKGHRAMEKLHVIENGYLVEKEPSYAHEGNPELEHLAQPEVSSKRRRQLHKPVIDSGYDVQQQTQFNRRVEEIIDRQQNHENDHKSITEIQQSKRSRGLRSAPEAVDAKPKAGFAASHQRLALSSAALSSVDKLKKEFKTTEKSTEGAESVVGQSLKFVDAPDKSSTGVVAFSSKAVAASKPKKPSPPAQIVADALKPPPGCNNDSDFLVQQMLRKHDRRKVPKTKDGGGVTVTVELWVQEISSIIEINSEFELDLYVTEQWKDPSLSFDEFNPCKKNLSLDADAMIRQIWTPNSCFVNSKNASIHRSPYRNIFLMIYDSGVVWLNYRTKIIGPCAKENKSFPIDNQRCSLTYESYNHNSDDVVMRWLQPNPVLILGSINLPDYELVNFSYIHVEKNYPPGKWDELTVTFVFQRLYGFYILQAYVPAYLIIFLSWVSFYLGSKSIPSRTTVCVNCFLALAFQFGSIMQTLPRTNAVRSIHVWILSCMGFIFCSLLELAIIGYMAWNDQMGTGLDCSCPLLCFECPMLTAIRIDAISMVAFPASFVIFNIYYWGIYIT